MRATTVLAPESDRPDPRGARLPVFAAGRRLGDLLIDDVWEFSDGRGTGVSGEVVPVAVAASAAAGGR